MNNMNAEVPPEGNGVSEFSLGFQEAYKIYLSRAVERSQQNMLVLGYFICGLGIITNAAFIQTFELAKFGVALGVLSFAFAYFTDFVFVTAGKPGKDTLALSFGSIISCALCHFCWFISL